MPEFSTFAQGSVGEWPGLGECQLVGPDDLAVRTDDRDIISEILRKKCLNNPEINEIFPAHQAKVQMNIIALWIFTLRLTVHEDREVELKRG